LPNARNIAAHLAKGELLIFVDDDILPDENFIMDFIKEFDKHYHENCVIGGRIQETGSDMMNTTPKIIGGNITSYGKPIRNFNSEKSGNCEWVAGGNFAVRKEIFLQIKGFDKNFIGNAMFEDCDFCFTVKENGGQVYYSPKPFVEHLRAVTGGTRQINKSKGMYYRAHNTVYFLRKHEFKLRLISTFFYLNAVAIKDLFLRRHGISAIFWSWMGYFKGFTTK
jgi:GT2 family glycosyltransferase